MTNTRYTDSMMSGLTTDQLADELDALAVAEASLSGQIGGAERAAQIQAHCDRRIVGRALWARAEAEYGSLTPAQLDRYQNICDAIPGLAV